MTHYSVEEQLVDANNSGIANPATRLKQVLVVFNRLVALGYFVAAFWVTIGMVVAHTSFVGSTVLAACFIWIAFGHFVLKPWAPKVTAALFGVAEIMAIFYLLSGFEQSLVSTFEERLVKFSVLTLVTSVLVTNFYLCEKVVARKS